MTWKKVWPWVCAALIGAAVGMRLVGTPERHGEASSTGRVAGTTDPFMASVAATLGASTPAGLQADFEAALRQPHSLALQRAFTRWLLTAPDEAMAQAGRLPAEERRTIISTALAELAQRAPASFERYAPMLERAQLAAVLGVWAEQQPAQAIDWVRRHPQLDGGAALTAALLPALIRKDAALAAQAVAALKERAPLALIQQVAAAYTRHNPAGAYAWVHQVTQQRTDVTPARVLGEVSSSLVASDPNAALDYMGRTDDPAVRQSLMNEIAIRKGQDDLAGAMDWLGQYSSDPAYADAAQQLLYRWSYAKPDEVARLLPQVSDAAVQADAAAHLTRFWQQKDNAAYQQWLASLPPGKLRDLAFAAR